MSVPQHGLFCRTHTFPTKCRHCSDPVFFFSCTCGSKVFFDKLGAPWIEHNCAFSLSDERWAKSRRRTKLADGSVVVEITDGVTAIRHGENSGKSWNIHPKVAVTARRDAQSRESNPIESVPPGEDWTKEIVGVIRELHPRVDVYRRLKLPRTSVTKGFLGDLGCGEWGRMTFHVIESKIYSYTAWVPTSLLTLPEFRFGTTVSATLRRLDVPKKAREWVCQEFCVR